MVNFAQQGAVRDVLFMCWQWNVALLVQVTVHAVCGNNTHTNHSVDATHAGVLCSTTCLVNKSATYRWPVPKSYALLVCMWWCTTTVSVSPEHTWINESIVATSSAQLCSLQRCYQATTPTFYHCCGTALQLKRMGFQSLKEWHQQYFTRVNRHRKVWQHSDVTHRAYRLVNATSVSRPQSLAIVREDALQCWDYVSRSLMISRIQVSKNSSNWDWFYNHSVGCSSVGCW